LTGFSCRTGYVNSFQNFGPVFKLFYV
jgi:hypothetical protein